MKKKTWSALSVTVTLALCSVLMLAVGLTASFGKGNALTASDSLMARFTFDTAPAALAGGGTDTGYTASYTGADSVERTVTATVKKKSGGSAVLNETNPEGANGLTLTNAAVSVTGINSAADKVTDLSVSMWVNVPSGGSDWDILAGFRSSAVTVGSATVTNLCVSSGNNIDLWNGSSFLSNGFAGTDVRGAGWKNIVFVLPSTGNNFTIYVDGAAKDYDVFSSGNTTVKPIECLRAMMTQADFAFDLGFASHSGAYIAKADVDDLRLYNKALTKAEVEAVLAEGVAADLASIAIGETVIDVSADPIQKEWEYVYNEAGYPAVTATAAVEGATVVVGEGADNIVPITVTNGDMSKTYRLRIKRPAGNSVSSITFGDNVAVEDMRFDTYTYNVTVAADYTAPPQIAAVLLDPTSGATFEYTQAAAWSNDGKATASVVSKLADQEDLTYTVNFTRIPASTLSAVKLGETAISYFRPTFYTYGVTLKTGTTAAPTLTPVIDFDSTLYTLTNTQAATLEDDTVFTVTDKVTGQSNTYTFSFNAVSNANIAANYVFDAATDDTNAKIADAANPDDTARQASTTTTSAQTVSFADGAINLNGGYVTVPKGVLSSMNGVNEITFQTWIKTESNVGDWCHFMAMNGGGFEFSLSYTGFNPRNTKVGNGMIYGGSTATTATNDGLWHLMTYAITQAEGTLYIDGVKQYTITCDAKSADVITDWTALMNYWDASGMNIFLGRNLANNESERFIGSMKDFRIYNVALTKETIDQYMTGVNPNRLESLKVNGTELEGFASNNYSYEYIYDADTVKAIPEITFTAAEGATASIEAHELTVDTLNGQTIRVIVSSPGADNVTYAITFYAGSSNTRLNAIKLAGKDVTGFAADKYNYYVEKGASFPTVTATAASPYALVSVTTPTNNRPATVTVSSTLEGVEPTVYRVFFLAAADLSNSAAKEIKVGDETVEITGTELTYKLAEGTTDVPTVTATAAFATFRVGTGATVYTGATVTVTQAGSIDEAATVTVTALDGSTTVYTVRFTTDASGTGENGGEEGGKKGCGCGGTVAGSVGMTLGGLLVLGAVLTVLFRKRRKA